MHDFGSFWWDLGPNQLHIIIGNWLCFCNFRVLCNSYFYRVYSNKAFKILTILATRQSFSLRTSCNVCLFSPTLIVTTIHISKPPFLEGFFVFFIFTFRILLKDMPNKTKLAYVSPRFILDSDSGSQGVKG